MIVVLSILLGSAKYLLLEEAELLKSQMMRSIISPMKHLNCSYKAISNAAPKADVSLRLLSQINFCFAVDAKRQ